MLDVPRARTSGSCVPPTRTVCLGLAWWWLTTGCHQPGWQISVRIEEAGEPGQPTRLASDAQIRLECPGRAPGGHVRGDGDGFRVVGRGAGLSLRCSLIVEKAGYLPARVSLGAACVRLYPEERWVERGPERVCNTAEVRVTLTAQARATR